MPELTSIRTKPKYAKKVEAFALEAISLFEPNLTLKNGKMIEYEKRLYVLGNLIDICGYNSNTDQKRDIINGGLKIFSKNPNKSIDALFDAIKTEQERTLQKPKKKFWAAFNFNADYEWLKKKRHFIINSNEIRISNFKYLQKNFELDSPGKLPEDLNKFRDSLPTPQRLIDALPELKHHSYLMMEVFATDGNDALLQTHNEFEILRAVFNFVIDKGYIHWTFGKPSPLANIGQARYIFVFDENKKFELYGENDINEKFYRKFNPRNDASNILNEVSKFLTQLEQQKQNKLREILIDALRFHNNALTQNERGYSFLSFFQVLELVSLPEGKTNFDLIKKKVKAIFVDKQLIPDVIDAIFVKRNQLVHEGKIENLTDIDLNRVKPISESCIMFLLNNMKILKTRENFNTYYANISCDKKELREKFKVFKYITKIKFRD
jgi:hypothetical protein